jgi:hypothetical protein
MLKKKERQMAKNVNPEMVQRLADVFRGLGATDPDSWARSQLEEGIGQLAHFVFLKQAWHSILDENKVDDWIKEAIRMGETYPASFREHLALALQKVLAHGVNAGELGSLIQLVQYQTLNELCFLLDDGGVASPVNSKDRAWPPIRWALHQVDEERQVIDHIGGLHEYSDGEPAHGRQSGFR